MDKNLKYEAVGHAEMNPYTYPTQTYIRLSEHAEYFYIVSGYEEVALGKEKGDCFHVVIYGETEQGLHLVRLKNNADEIFKIDLRETKEQ